MSRIRSRLVPALFSLAVALSLGFGASQAFASASAACTDPYADGSCDTQSKCEHLCFANYGTFEASCTDGCCYGF